MTLRHLNPLPLKRARCDCRHARSRNEMSASSEKVVTKMPTRLGWPEPIIKGMTTQIQSATKMQTQMTDVMLPARERHSDILAL